MSSRLTPVSYTHLDVYKRQGVTYKVNGLEIGSIDKIWYEFEELETELLTETPGDEEDSSKPADENKTNPSTGR